MDGNSRNFASDVAFTEAVKAEQARRGSRDGYAQAMEKRDRQAEVTPDLAAFLAEPDSLYMATVSSDGHPYIQHHGGPKGFLRAGRANARLCRLRRQPPVHFARQPGRQRPRPPVPDGLCQPPPHQAVGAGQGGGGRRGPPRPPRRARLSRQARARLRLGPADLLPAPARRGPSPAGGMRCQTRRSAPHATVPAPAPSSGPARWRGSKPNRRCPRHA